MPIHQAIAATNADAGIVKIQAHTILPATPQRTADIDAHDKGVTRGSHSGAFVLLSVLT